MSESWVLVMLSDSCIAYLEQILVEGVKPRPQTAHPSTPLPSMDVDDVTWRSIAHTTRDTYRKRSPYLECPHDITSQEIHAVIVRYTVHMQL